MGSERSLWKTLDRNMKEYWEAERVENPVGPGTPDLYVTMKANGNMHWIELKHVHGYPKRATTIVDVDHFTPQQRSFIRRHSRIGANVWVLIQIHRDYFLFHGMNALKVGKLTREGYFIHADYKWSGKIDYDRFRSVFLIFP